MFPWTNDKNIEIIVPKFAVFPDKFCFNFKVRLLIKIIIVHVLPTLVGIALLR